MGCHKRNKTNRESPVIEANVSPKPMRFSVISGRSSKSHSEATEESSVVRRSITANTSVIQNATWIPTMNPDPNAARTTLHTLSPVNAVVMPTTTVTIGTTMETRSFNNLMYSG